MISRPMTLFPVVQPVVEASQGLSGEERVSRLSAIAREALRLSAEKSGVVLGELSKDEDDVPLPFDDNHWSVSHKPRCVAAVVSKGRIGIDVEEIRPRTEDIFRLVASDEEWRLHTDRSWDTFFRYWTAKEAVLKAVGIGIGGLKKCRVVSIPDESHVLLDYKDAMFLVEQLRYGNHVVSVLKGNNDVKWTVVGDHSHS